MSFRKDEEHLTLQTNGPQEHFRFHFILLFILFSSVKIKLPSFQIQNKNQNPCQCVKPLHSRLEIPAAWKVSNSVAALQIVAFEPHPSRQLARPNLDTLDTLGPSGGR